MYYEAFENPMEILQEIMEYEEKIKEESHVKNRKELNRKIETTNQYS